MSHFQDKVMENHAVLPWFSLPLPLSFAFHLSISLSFCLYLSLSISLSLFFYLSSSSSPSFPLSPKTLTFGIQPLCCKPHFRIQATRRGHMWVFEETLQPISWPSAIIHFQKSCMNKSSDYSNWSPGITEQRQAVPSLFFFFLIHSCPTESINIIKDCFMPLSFGVIYYTATVNGIPYIQQNKLWN